MRTHRLTLNWFMAVLAGIGTFSACGFSAQGGMTLTATAIKDGFQLSTFASNFPDKGGIGPVGIGFLGSSVFVSDYNSGEIYKFPDIDGQVASAANRLSQTGAGDNFTGFATIGAKLYMGLQGSGTVGTIDPTTGAFTALFSSGSIPAATSLIADPTTGDLYVSGLGNGIYRVSNLAGTPVIDHFSNVAADGISLSTDGSTIYAASNGNLVAVSTSTGKSIRDYGAVGNGLDGTALGTGTIAGYIFANTNGGQIISVDLATGTQTLIADGGSRGDLVEVDPNGTLLLTQANSVLRLTAPPGGGFVPEPGTGVSAATAMGLTFLVAAWRRRRIRKG